MKKILIIFFSITVFIMASTSQEEIFNNMEYYASLYDEATDNMEMEEALSLYTEYLNRDIDVTYKYLLSKLNKNLPLKNAFMASQNEWIKQRDKEFKFLELAFEKARGSFSGISLGLHKQNVLESRLIYLSKLMPVEGDISGILEFY